MRLALFRRFARVKRATPILALPIALSLAGSAWAEDAPGPQDYDLDIRAEKAEYLSTETIVTNAGVVARKAGIQGWSYGVEHDPAVLDIVSVTTDGTNVDDLFDQGFNQTAIVERDGQPAGYIQGIVLALVKKVEVPVSDYFKMSDARYTLKAGACAGKDGQLITTKIEFTSTLNVQGSPPVDINLTVGGKTVDPAVILGEDVKVRCGVVIPEGLALQFDKADTDLVADQASLYDLKVHVANTGDASIAILGWSYGVEIDPNELVPVSGAPGADSQALNGGAGPEFVDYQLDATSAGGAKSGIIVGGVINLVAPATQKLSIGAGAKRHIDTIKLKSNQSIPEGGASRQTVIRFTDQLLSNEPVEAIATKDNGDTIPLDISDTLTLTLKGGAPVEQPLFIRGDANNDARVDIADGVWIINELFYSGRETQCKAAADSNADGKRDLSDAMYIFQYQLQPGATPSTLFPKPPAPFPNCGTAAGVTFDDCPLGSTTCMQ